MVLRSTTWRVLLAAAAATGLALGSSASAGPAQQESSQLAVYGQEGCDATILCDGRAAYDEELRLTSLFAETHIAEGRNDVTDDVVSHPSHPNSDYRGGWVTARGTVDHPVFTPPGLSAAKLTVTLDVPVLRSQEDGSHYSAINHWRTDAEGWVVSEVRWTGCGQSTCTTPLRDFAPGGTHPAAEGVQEAVVELRAAPGERVANVVVHTRGSASASASDDCDPCTEDKGATAQTQFRVAEVKVQGISG